MRLMPPECVVDTHVRLNHAKVCRGDGRLCCDKCSKRRRVGKATLAIFANEYFLQGFVQQRLGLLWGVVPTLREEMQTAFAHCSQGGVLFAHRLLDEVVHAHCGVSVDMVQPQVFERRLFGFVCVLFISARCGFVSVLGRSRRSVL